MRDWKRKRRKFLGPLVPKTAEQAAAWLRNRTRLALGFVTVLLRDGGKIVLKSGKHVEQSWADPKPPRRDVAREVRDAVKRAIPLSANNTRGVRAT